MQIQRLIIVFAAYYQPLWQSVRSFELGSAEKYFNLHRPLGYESIAFGAGMCKIVVDYEFDC
ncbi:MAG: hypothetical protein V3W45_01205 [Sedimentisphaerales bacterium]